MALQEFLLILSEIAKKNAIHSDQVHKWLSAPSSFYKNILIGQLCFEMFFDTLESFLCRRFTSSN